MTTLRRSLSSLNALATFEAAARLGSFTQAAHELGVTQAAVSRQIKLLEVDLNTPLFLRVHRRVVLTPAGEALATTVTGAFGRMAEMIETLRQPLVPEAVTIGSTLAFSHFWLLPRLPEFRAAHPDIKLKLVAEDSAADLRRDRLDVAIRYGKPPFEDGRSLASHPDRVFPVCSPKLLARLGVEAETAQLPNLPLITSDWINPAWLTWRSWARDAGLGPALTRASDLSRLRFNHYTDTIQAAVNGEGVALGWATLLSGLLAEGRLVRVGRHSVELEERYHVVVPAGREPAPATAAFLDWITGRFQADA
ncbi:LysR family transcriptional regulator [Cereibacter sphaeroides]|uniref:LysR substrate-binding domain-containing protein n=1 Tax=Cereibacter sphaeroides TaxID=1063 RepID=UPI001F16A792|nr:LysR substrate-binding domain-containing protein [Cereibacter sphaeroides]MCE6959822.1 LysR family transcriptional regulator [Cereibacter sphaeroides]MCE6974676.1 LysR family transcriptional regulator [Cereibacter sphaeroides]